VGEAPQRLALPRGGGSGKISEMNTQITAPCPTACAAMKAKMQAGTMA
jgi:hypothetical protein